MDSITQRKVEHFCHICRLEWTAILGLMNASSDKEERHGGGWTGFCSMLNETIDMAQNRPLWRLMSALVLRTPSGACQKWMNERTSKRASEHLI